jgi:protocatechuate 3,4-dioxygenase alpha subunit
MGEVELGAIVTGSQTVGPFFHIGFRGLYSPDLTRKGIDGEKIMLSGRVIDGDGQGVPDAAIETWQADSRGVYDVPEVVVRPAFKGFGRIPTEADGSFQLSTVKPGRVPGPRGALQAPHIGVTIFMRGLLRHLYTRIYFPDEAANAEDPILRLVEASRRNTLIARQVSKMPTAFEWDIILQGQSETVFFEC